MTQADPDDSLPPLASGLPRRAFRWGIPNVIGGVLWMITLTPLLSSDGGLDSVLGYLGLALFLGSPIFALGRGAGWPACGAILGGAALAALALSVLILATAGPHDNDGGAAMAVVLLASVAFWYGVTVVALFGVVHLLRRAGWRLVREKQRDA